MYIISCETNLQQFYAGGLPQGRASAFTAHVPAMFRQLQAGENAVCLPVVTGTNSVFSPLESI